MSVLKRHEGLLLFHLSLYMEILVNSFYFITQLFFENTKELCELAPLFSPNRHGTCEAADNLTIVKVGIRFPSFLPCRYFKRKRIVEDRHSNFYKRLLRLQAQLIIVRVV